MTNCIPVVFCFDSRIILGASVAIKSLIDCAKDSTIYDIRIFHSDISLENQKKITKLTQNTRHKLAFHYIDPDLFKNAPRSKGSWTEIVYYRLLIPEILNEYDKVIYSDVDVLFKDDLEEVYNTDLNGYDFAAVKAEKNNPNTICHRYFADNKNEFIFWSGFMLMNCKKFREEKIFDQLLMNAEKYYKDLKFFDLDLINITCQRIKAIDLKYCVMQSIYYNDDFRNRNEYRFLKNIYTDDEIEKSKYNPVIIHYGGKPGKPWRLKHTYNDYQKYLNVLPKELIQYTFRDIRKKFFNKHNVPLINIDASTKCLLVAPHPDDDTIGAGGVLLRYAKNFDCICIGSSGVELKEPYITPKERSEMRISEFHNVMNNIGVNKHWIFETYGVPRFDDQIEGHFAEYCDALSDLKKYDYIFLPHPLDGHHEHRFITNKLFKKIIKKVGYNPDTKIVFYEVWASITKDNAYFDISSENGAFFFNKKQNNDKCKSDYDFTNSLFNKKMEVTKQYKSQWDYDDLEHVPVIKRQLKRPAERYRVLTIEEYLRLISFNFSYGIVGL